MKILLLCDNMEVGGAETHVAELARGLTELGDEVSILSGGGALADRLEKEGIRQHRVPLPTHNPFRLLAIRKKIRRLARKEKFDILHAHARIPAFLLRGRGLCGTRIVTAHARFRCDPILKRLCYWGERTVAVSEDLRDYLHLEYSLPCERIEVIPNGIDCSRFSPDGERKKNSAPRILFVSRLDRDCSLGAELLCRIAPDFCLRYPEIRITLVGGGNDLERIKALARTANTALCYDAISVLGARNDVQALMREHDILIGVSRAALEACACGLAVILCGNEGYLGILNEERFDEAIHSNFCARGHQPPNARMLQADLSHLLDHPTLRLRYAAECRNRVQRDFGSETMCRATRSLYRSTLSPIYRRTLTVGGYFGCGNPGDDAILLGLVREMRRTAPDIRILALTKHPRRDGRRFGIRCYGRTNPFSLLVSVLRSDAFLFGGGSLLQNKTSNRSLRYYLFLLRLARFFGRPILFCGAGIGPLIGKRACASVARALQQCHYIGVRDFESLRFLRALGVDAALLHEGADPALLLPPPPFSRASYLLQKAALTSKKRSLCLVMRGEKENEVTFSILIASTRILCARYDLEPLLLLLDTSHDADATSRAKAALNATVLAYRNAEDIMAILSCADCLISMRLHALVFGCSVGTPGIGIVADPRDGKIEAFCKSAGLESIPADRLTVPLLVERAELLMREKKRNSALLCASRDELRKKAEKDLENITKMIYNSRQ